MGDTKIVEQIPGMSEEQFGEIFIACCQRVQREGGRLPVQAYFVKNRTFATPFVEIICAHRRSDGGISILLEQRPNTDPYFAGQWCCQGTTLLGRQSLEDVARKHGENECCIPLRGGEAAQLKFAGVAHLPHTTREHALSVIFIRWIDEPNRAGEWWFPIDGPLPEPFVESMRGAMGVAFDYLRTGTVGWHEYLGE